MGNRPSRLVISIPTASGDGKYYGRYPNGNAPVGSVALAATPEDDSSASAALTTGSALAITNSSPLPSGAVASAYSVTLTAAGGTAPYTWALVSGTLPAGLSLNGAVISGTPTAVSSVSLTFQVTDSATPSHNVVQKALSLTINAASGLTALWTDPLPNGYVGVPYSFTLAAAGGVPPYTFAVQTGTLPGGLGLNASTGVISGTPTTISMEAVTFTVTDSA
jgi:hypothetical protein